MDSLPQLEDIRSEMIEYRLSREIRQIQRNYATLGEAKRFGDIDKCLAEADFAGMEVAAIVSHLRGAYPHKKKLNNFVAAVSRGRAEINKRGNNLGDSLLNGIWHKPPVEKPQ